MSIPRSLTLKRIKYHLGANLGVTALIMLVRTQGVKLAMPALAHTMCGGFLGLLLVFRTNAAYARFWEARLLWGQVMSATRKLCLMLQSTVRPTEPARAEHLMACLKAFPVALARLCQGSTDEIPPQLAALLPAGFRRGEGRRGATAAALCMQLRLSMAEFAHQLRAGGGGDAHAAHVEEEAAHLIGELVGAITGCERIRRTPVPFTYSRHTSRCLSMWCGTLPLVLVDALGAAALPAMAAICWCLFGIEEIGHLIEQPFTAGRAAERAGGHADAEAGNEDDESVLRRGGSWCVGLPVDVLALEIAKEVELLTDLAPHGWSAAPSAGHGLGLGDGPHQHAPHHAAAPHAVPHAASGY